LKPERLNTIEEFERGLRGYKAAAPLKQDAKESHDGAGGEPPRLQSRGPIEAPCHRTTPPRNNLPPRLQSRGPIEADEQVRDLLIVVASAATKPRPH